LQPTSTYLRWIITKDVEYGDEDKYSKSRDEVFWSFNGNIDNNERDNEQSCRHYEQPVASETKQW